VLWLNPTGCTNLRLLVSRPVWHLNGRGATRPDRGPDAQNVKAGQRRHHDAD
jgi:hypothetical protein